MSHVDYIYERTDVPRGMLYKGKAKIEISNPEMEKFTDLTDVANIEQLLRIIQSIPSLKAEPFKI